MMTMTNAVDPGLINSNKKQKDTLTNERKLLLYFSSCAHAYTHIVILAIVPLLPLIQSAEGGFNLSWRDSFFFAALSLFFFGFGAIPTGFIADRIGPLKVIFSGLIVIIISIVMIILSPDVIIFSIAIVLLGLGSSFYHPAGLSLVSQVFTSERGLPMGIHGSLGNLGELTTPILSGMIGAMFGWRSAYLLWLSVGIVILIVNLILISKGTQSHFISKENIQTNRNSTKKLFLKALSLAIILAMAFGLLFELAYRGTIQLIPFAAKTFHGLSPGEAASVGGIIVTILMLAGAFAQLVGGKLADKFGNKLPLFFLTVLAVMALIIMKSQGFATVVSINGTPLIVDTLLLGAVLFGFGLFGTQVILNVIFAEATPPQIRGLFYGLMFFIKVGLASLALVSLAFISEATISTGFYLLISFALGAAIIVIFMKETSRKYTGISTKSMRSGAWR
jgi:MFS family permease